MHVSYFQQNVLDLHLMQQGTLYQVMTTVLRACLIVKFDSFLMHQLRAPDCKYQKSYDRQEISYFILFHLNVSFGELFSKNTIKSSAALSFFEKLEKLNLRLHARLSSLGKWEIHASLPSSHFAMETIPVILPRLQVNLSIISR